MKRVMLPLLMLLLALVPLGFTRPAASLAPTDLTIYDDNLQGWENWSWDGIYTFNETGTVHSGTQAIAVTYQAWGGLYLHSGEVTTAGYTSLRFQLHGGSAGGQALRVYVNGSGVNTVAVQATAGAWQEVDIPLSSFGSPSILTDIVWQDTTGTAQPTFYIDQISLIGNPPPPGNVTLNVDAQSGQQAISPYIYGMNFAEETLADELNLPLNRWGGNSTSRYNWQLNVHNTGSDWFFENIPSDQAPDAELPNGSATNLFVDQNERTGTESLITIPLMGWVAKRRLDNHPYDCGFKVSVYGAQQLVDEWDPDCGNGYLPNGTQISGGNPLDTSTAVDETFAAGWIAHLSGRYGSANEGGVRFYALDNEPMLWNETHRDVHPAATSYDEMRDLAYQYGAAIRAADPHAQIVGPVLFGWTAYWYSALDWEPGGAWWNNPQDRLAHGNVPFAPWYLQQMAAYEEEHGVRLLDYFDLHYYPQAPGVTLAPAGSEETQSLRLRSTRSLWDPTYADESWINGTEGGPEVELIPRMKQWVAENYPGTKIAITEYNWGGHEHINGALAQADVLGIFGREGVDLATIWGPPASADPAAYAFRMYLNYDGAGAHFGETSVFSSSSDQAQLAIYGARRTADGALTVMVINKTGDEITAELNLAGFNPAGAAAVYRYSEANLNAIVSAPAVPVNGSQLTTSYPANSITLLVIPAVPVEFNHHAYLPVLRR